MGIFEFLKDSTTNLVEILSFLMLIMGLALSFSRTVHQMIPYYQAQCVALAIVTSLTALERAFERTSDSLYFASVGVFAIIPILLAIYIEPLLAQATVVETVSVKQRLLRVVNWRMRLQARAEAMPAWLHSRRSRRSTMTLLVIDLFMVALAFITAFMLAGTSNPAFLVGSSQTVTETSSGLPQVNTMVLAVSFSLLLLGITTMINTEDIISQVVGLLVMEQGMFLAAVRFIPNSVMLIFFILGLFVYIIITLTILVFLLPELHNKSGSLDIDQQTRLKG